MTEPVRLGLVGCGRLAAQGYAPALDELPGVVVVGVVDPEPTRRQALAARVGGAAPFADVDALLSQVPLDGLVIASPVQHHLADARAAASAGLRALVEKPPARSAAETAPLARLDPAPFIGFNRRFDPGAAAARDALEGRTGVELDLVLHYRRASWAPHTVADDALLDLGPHLIDWARWLLGCVTSVTCSTLEPTRARLELELARGAASIDLAVDRPHLERLAARGPSGAALVDHRIGGLVAGLRARVARPAGPSPLVRTLRAQLATYADALRGGDPDRLGTVAEGIEVMAVIDAARTSAADHGSPIPPTPQDHH